MTKRNTPSLELTIDEITPEDFEEILRDPRFYKLAEKKRNDEKRTLRGLYLDL